MEGGGVGRRDVRCRMQVRRCVWKKLRCRIVARWVSMQISSLRAWKRISVLRQRWSTLVRGSNKFVGSNRNGFGRVGCSRMRVLTGFARRGHRWRRLVGDEHKCPRARGAAEEVPREVRTNEVHSAWKRTL